MTDMTSGGLHDDHEPTFTRPIAAAEEATEGQSPFDPAYVQLLELVAAELQDGLDHPEVWQLLQEIGSGDDVGALIATIAALRELQSDPRLVKAFDIVFAVLMAVAVDQAEGMAQIKQLEAVYALCPQVAGACFFVSRLGEPDKSADLSTKFCESPFVKFETLIDGTVAPCCSIWTKKRLGQLDTQNFEEIWNSQDAQEMRESILDGSFRYCNKQRCSFIMDDTLPDRDAITDPELRQIIDGNITRLDMKPRWLFLAHDATCNLACPSCRSGIEIASPAQEARFDVIMEQVFHPLLSSGSRMLVSISGQGDPWSSQHYRAILRHMADHDLPVDLNIHTNAQLMGPKRWAEFAGLEKYKPLVSVSIDAATPWVYDYVRRPGKFDRLVENLSFLAAKHEEGIFREFETNATIQLDNFHELPALIDLAERMGNERIYLYMIQNTGAHLARSYDHKNVADVQHPLHLAFLETLRDTKLDRPVVQMYDVGTWREIALNQRLPSDELAAGFTRQDVYVAIEARLAVDDWMAAAALCVAGRIRFPDDHDILRIEADTLDQLGFARQAGYRRSMADQVEQAAGVTEPRAYGRAVDRIKV